MKLTILLTILLTLAACSPIRDTAALRATYEAKVTPTVLGKPPMLGGSIRVRIVPPPTPTANYVPTVTPTPKASTP